MCHAFDLEYSCGHVVTDWFYCQYAPYDHATNTRSACNNPQFPSGNTFTPGKCSHNWCPWTGEVWRCCHYLFGPNILAACVGYVQRQGVQAPEMCMHLMCGMCESMDGEISPLPTKPVWLWCMLTAIDGGDDDTLFSGGGGEGSGGKKRKGQHEGSGASQGSKKHKHGGSDLAWVAGESLRILRE